MTTTHSAFQTQRGSYTVNLQNYDSRHRKDPYKLYPAKEPGMEGAGCWAQSPIHS